MDDPRFRGGAELAAPALIALWHNISPSLPIMLHAPTLTKLNLSTEDMAMSDPRSGSCYCAMLLAAALSLSSCASFQNHPREIKSASDPAVQPDTKMEATGKKAGEIVTQPARDIGLDKTEVPAALAHASEDPYAVKGVRKCTQLVLAIEELNIALGPDFVVGDEKQENIAGKLAEAGGKTVVNALIPFRALVREISGAAPAQRRLDDAIDAGFARRGFLRGLQRKQGCRTTS